MRIIKRLSDDIVLMVGDTLELDEVRAFDPALRILNFDISTGNAALVEVAGVAPLNWVAGAYAHRAGGWALEHRELLAPLLAVSTIGERRTQASVVIDLHAKALRDNVVALISPAEMSSWPIKQAQALAFQAGGGDAAAPMLVAEAGYRQCTTAELVDMVLAKAQQLAGLEAMISGECGRRQDILRTLDDVDLISAIAAGVLVGWPGFPDTAQ